MAILWEVDLPDRQINVIDLDVILMDTGIDVRWVILVMGIAIPHDPDRLCNPLADIRVDPASILPDILNLCILNILYLCLLYIPNIFNLSHISLLLLLLLHSTVFLPNTSKFLLFHVRDRQYLSGIVLLCRVLPIFYMLFARLLQVGIL